MDISAASELPLVHGGIYYLDLFSLVDKYLQPRSYFEIGTNTGESLGRFGCDAVCVDPEFLIEARVWRARNRTFLYQMTSDNFFSEVALRSHFPSGPDVIFLDGLHRAEYLLRDFMNTERVAHARSLIFMHDCLPLSTRMAERVARQGDEAEGIHKNSWTGDVWRVLFALKQFRPELRIRYLDCPPTGLIAISGLNPSNVDLSAAYNDAVDYMMSLDLTGARLRDLWSMYPILNTRAFEVRPEEITAALNCR